MFSLVRRACLSSYKNIIWIFLLVRTAFSPSYKNIVSIFSLVRTVFFLLVSFSIHKMANSEYSTGDCKSSKISIVAIIKFQEMLKFVSDHLETKKICKHSVKNCLL